MVTCSESFTLLLCLFSFLTELRLNSLTPCKAGAELSNTDSCGTGEFQCSESGLCIPSTWTCDESHDCPDPDFSDESPLICKGTQGCTSSEFQCANQQQCIPSSWKCDRELDCLDGSDEDFQMCSNFTCSIDQFTCMEGDSKKCLPLTWVCDGTSDCKDGSDEHTCNATCTSNEFTCSNGRCIVSSWKCDSNKDCDDGSDEVDCPVRTCIPGKEFMCKNDSSCILANWVCDNEIDCSDASDENENCNVSTSAVASQCGKQEFECRDRLTCIHKSWVCDGFNDCMDASDEDTTLCNATTKCRPDQFQCQNLECIPSHMRCSKTVECSDSSDEEDCPPSMEISSYCDFKTHFRCSNTCIPLHKMCDQVNDCGNWEDEPKEKCGVNECAVNNGGCKEVCVDTTAGHYCDCKPGFMIINNNTCQDINECDIPGFCSQTCTNEKGGYKCGCLEGYLRDPKQPNKCKAVEGHASLLFALRHNIRKISLDHLKMTLIVENTRSATALDYMFRTGMIFWSDSHDGRIFKAPIDEGQSQSVVVDCGVKGCDGLAVDWIYNHIYWIESRNKTISVAELDGKMKKVLIENDLAEPRSIAVNPIQGWMFWCDWGQTPGRIERAGMDGSSREIIVNSGLKWPNGLTLDLIHNRLYWVDAKINSIFSVNFDGSKRRVILQSKEFLGHPFSITTFEDYIYWTDWTKETIFRANKFNGTEVTPVLLEGTVKNVMSVHVYHAYRQPDGENHCTPLNGRCSHLCLPAPKLGHGSVMISCACPDGTTFLKDGQNQTCISDPGYSRNAWTPNNNTLPDLLTSGNNHSNASRKSPGRTSVENESKTQITKEDVSRKDSNQGGDSGAVLIVVGILSSILILTVVVVLFMYRNVFVKTTEGMNFDNPVYRKTTTEDHISIEKNRGFHKTYPATISEEHFGFFDPLVQEPLTNGVGVNEYV